MLQEMVEELEHSGLEVDPVGHTQRPMRLACIVEQPAGLTESFHRHEILDSLIPGHMTVGVIVHDQDRGLYLVHREEGRIGVIAVGRAPRRATQTALRVLILEGPCHARSPADTAISAEHVDNRRSRLDCGEEVGACRRVAR